MAALARLTPPLRVLLFLAGLALLWLPLALPLYILAATGALDLGGAIATGLLYVGFLLIWPTWAKQVHRLQLPWQTLGLIWRPGIAVDWVVGLSLGLGGIAALVGIELALGWAVLLPPTAQLPRFFVEGALVGLAVGVAEEILFRGWLLFELEQGWSRGQALVGTALVFAIAHFIKPLPAILATLPQFFGLFLLALTLVWARRTPSHVQSHNQPGRTALGYPAGLHGGLVWGYYLVNVGQVIQITGAVPEWVTGIQANPLAGLLGLGLLAGLAGLFYRSAHQPG
ncbi:type II CAAX endopeptidase family protein [Pseudanabaena sp. FACHB-2040]|uniref:CPBP family glutamic-type intramembrane protease n=1 Tax=Pseudanabaena sp. FACHB-2040 TaxID=2692859 RepID=UPI001688909B|nr:CPBP family intramembrane metalloprotease [Pseudanabaena sp. FACHB-2040]